MIGFTGSESLSNDMASLLSSIACGRLPRLRSLSFTIADEDMWKTPTIAGIVFPPDSLPDLQHLYIGVPIEQGVLAGLFGAAGPKLTAIELDDIHADSADSVAVQGLSLLAENDYPWLAALQKLYLNAEFSSSCWGARECQQIVATAARLPALKELHCPAFDGVVVGLLALAENGGLLNLTELALGQRPDDGHDEENEHEDDYFPPPVFPPPVVSARLGLSVGALALLLLWLKREAKKEAEGQGPGVVWDVRGLHGMNIPVSAKAMVSHCVAQLEEARARVRG